MLLVAAPGALACANEDVAACDPAAVAATLCLLNEQRSAHGLGALSESPVLDRAASAYAADMVDRGFFDHVSPGGGTIMDRIKAAGWVPSGAGPRARTSPGARASTHAGVDRRRLDAQRRSPRQHPQRRVQPIGIGIADGAPQDGVHGEAGTYVTDFTSGTAAPPRPSHAARAARRPGRGSR